MSTHYLIMGMWDVACAGGIVAVLRLVLPKVMEPRGLRRFRICMGVILLFHALLLGADVVTAAWWAAAFDATMMAFAALIMMMLTARQRQIERNPDSGFRGVTGDELR